MGAKFSLTSFKVKLQVASKRMTMQQGKNENQVKVDKREIAVLLGKGKDEMARIRCEALLRLEDLIRCLEVLQLMVDVLLTRRQLVDSSKEPPLDLEEAMASIIYSHTRVPIPELKELTQMLGAKFGKDWATPHVNNDSGIVNKRVLKYLSIEPPPAQIVIKHLEEIAQEHDVEWEPHFEDEKLDEHANVIGSVVPLNYSPVDADVDSEFEFQPGTLNISVIEAKQLYNSQTFGKQDPYVKVSLSNFPNRIYKTRVQKDAGKACKFESEHFPFHVESRGLQVAIEVFNKNPVAADNFIGRAILSADKLITTPQPTWYRIGRDSDERTDAGYIAIATQYLPVNADPDDIATKLNTTAAKPMQVDDDDDDDDDHDSRLPAAPSHNVNVQSDDDDDSDDDDELEARLNALRG